MRRCKFSKMTWREFKSFVNDLDVLCQFGSEEYLKTRVGDKYKYIYSIYNNVIDFMGTSEFLNLNFDDEDYEYMEKNNVDEEELISDYVYSIDLIVRQIDKWLNK